MDSDKANRLLQLVSADDYEVFALTLETITVHGGDQRSLFLVMYNIMAIPGKLHFMTYILDSGFPLDPGLIAAMANAGNLDCDSLSSRKRWLLG